MKRSLAAAALLSALLVVGCSESGTAEAPAAAEAAVETAAPAEAPAARGAEPAQPAQPAAAGAPSYAVVYPGGEVTRPSTVAQGPAGPGGIVEFTTDATPEAVVAFYKKRAEAAGLKPITSLDQGRVKAYSAGDGADGRGQLIEVVATSVENSPTSVQLSWTTGR